MTWRETAVQTLRRVVPGRTTVAVVTAVGTVVAVEVSTHVPSRKLRSSQLYHSITDDVVTPAMRRFLDPETAHHAAIYFAKHGFTPIHRPSAAEQRCVVRTTLTFDHSNTTTNTSNSDGGGITAIVRPLTVPNPIGLAAGFDKDAEIIGPMLELGFGLCEVGTVTLLPQPGNTESPRMFRLPADLGIINRYGFNSLGAAVVEENLKAYYNKQQKESSRTNDSGNLFQQLLRRWLVPPPLQRIERGAVGINLGKNLSSVEAVNVVADYTALIRRLGPYADYLVVNISSPNTAGLRDWQTNTAQLQSLLTACIQARNAVVANTGDGTVPPLFVKLAPDLTDEQLQEIAKLLVAMDGGIDGIVVANTTNQRPADLIGHHVGQKEAGGLSGKPVRDMATVMIRKLYSATNGKLPIIGVGGVGSGHDAYEKLRAGASLVQVYSMMVYAGPGVVSRIRNELAEIMLLHGHRNVADVVGLDHEEIYWQKRQDRLELQAQTEKQLYQEPNDDIDNESSSEETTETAESSSTSSS